MSRRPTAPLLITLLLAALLGPSPAAAAKLYGADRCVSDKLRASAEVCEAVLGAWARYEQDEDQSRVDAAIGRARVKLAKAWSRAEKRVAKELACSETTVSSAEVAAAIEDAALALGAAVNGGLDLSDQGDADCGEGILAAAQAACEGLLRAVSLHVRQKGGDRLRLRLASDEAAVLADFNDAVGAARATCGTTATPKGLADDLDALVDDVVYATTVSPAVDAKGFTAIIPDDEVAYLGKKLRPICSLSTPYVFFAKRGTVNKLVVYYQGGGACWNYGTCNLPTYKVFADPVDDDPDGFTSGFADLADPRNPFRDWNSVMVPYCTGDIHWGDNAVDYALNDQTLHMEHRGAVNARVVEKWARDHFVLPEEVFVTGSSAGAYGAIANAPYHMEFAWPSSQFSVVGDAGNGVITNDFLVNDLNNWGLENNLPAWIPAFDGVDLSSLSLVDAYVEISRYYPHNRFATYTTSYDGGSGGQTGFYNIMLNGGNPVGALVWWAASCEWNAMMRAQNQTTHARAPSNFRYYIGTGSRHTMYGWPGVYDDVTGGVPTIVDWIGAMLAGAPEWQNVECTDCGTTLPGNPMPAILPNYPFDEDGNIACEE